MVAADPVMLRLQSAPVNRPERAGDKGRTPRRVSAGAVLVTLVLLIDGASAAAAQPVRGREATSDVTARPPWLPRTMHATTYVRPAAPFVPNELSAGSSVPRSDVTATVSDGGKLKFGLATIPVTSQTYPVISGNGGVTWEIDGPMFHVDAAQGASVVGSAGALRPHGAYFWGRGGNVIWITHDSGTQWSTVAFAAGVYQVSESKGTLEAVAFGNQTNHASAIQRFLYASVDSGKSWTFRRQLANLRAAS